MKLTPESTIREMFELFDCDEENGPVRVVPMTIKQQKDDTQLLILIKGEHMTASTIFASCMSVIDDLHALQAQAEADNGGPRSIIAS
ncbi:MAG: hypothetical protein E4H01_13450 [Lysobacterales bacterium]|nr:MAG: hypothetical protein E4H01_13450 [Xanthomonadales bacterium]